MLDKLKEKIRENLEADSNGPLTVSAMAEKIDELVNKVINLEDAVSSQTARTDKLRRENDDLHAQIHRLEDDKASLTCDDTCNLHDMLHEVEKKLDGIQDLNQNVEYHNNKLHTQFTEARCSIDHLSDKLYSVQTDEEVEKENSSEKQAISLVDAEPKEELEKKEAIQNCGTDNQNFNSLMTKDGVEIRKGDLHATANTLEAEGKEAGEKTEKQKDSMPRRKVPEQDLLLTEHNVPKPLPKETEVEQEGDPNWRKMLLSGFEGRQMVLLKECESVRKSYKEVKTKLSEVGKKNRDSCLDMTVEIRELKTVIAKLDEEVQSLNIRLKFLQVSLDESKDLKEDSSPASDHVDDQSAEPEPQTEISVVNDDLEIHLEKNEEFIK